MSGYSFSRSVRVLPRRKPTMEVEAHRRGPARRQRPACEADALTYEQAQERALFKRHCKPYALTEDLEDGYLRVWKKVPFRDRYSLLLCTRDTAHAYNFFNRSVADNM